MASVIRVGKAAPTLRAIFVRHAAAWIYLVGVCLGELVYVLLPPPDQAALLRWASTSVHNLTHHPVASLIASAFFPTGYLWAWPAVVALALFGATSVFGNWRTVVTCAAGQVVGTLISEGIVAYRVSAGSLPAADRFLLDVGPSYVVVAAIAVGMLYGSWLVRSAAVLDLALLIFVGQIFAGLSGLQVAAVGHLTALVTGMIVGTVLAWRIRRNDAVITN